MTVFEIVRKYNFPENVIIETGCQDDNVEWEMVKDEKATEWDFTADELTIWID